MPRLQKRRNDMDHLIDDSDVDLHEDEEGDDPLEA